MATTKPLSLRRQRFRNTKSQEENRGWVAQAEVAVDSGVYHLSDPFSYLIPTDLKEHVHVGSVVTVPFNTQESIGVVLSVGTINKAGLKGIYGLASDYLISEALMNLANKISQRYVCTQYDALRFVLPPLTKNSKNPSAIISSPRSARNSRCIFVATQIGESTNELIIQRIKRLPKVRRVVILPSAREVVRLAQILQSSEIEYIEVGSHLAKSAQKNAYLSAHKGLSPLVIGTRSAIFAPLSSLDEIIVVNEWSQHLYEQKAPYWNTRDLAVMRGQLESAEVFFVSSTPSTELMKLIQQQNVHTVPERKFSIARSRYRVTTAPDSYLHVVRRGLKDGAILVTVEEKNFSNLFLCKRCRTVAKCKCGGRIAMASRNAFFCTLCSESSRDWRCRECGINQFVMLSIGAEKIVEELGKSLPGVSILLSTADKPLDSCQVEKCVVIATSGMEPRNEHGYAAIVLLNGEELLSRPFVRAEEELLHRWFNTLQQVKRNGEIYSSLPLAHRISQAIVAENPSKLLVNELDERRVLRLPPIHDLILIESKTENLASLRTKLQEQFENCVTNLSHDSHRITVILSPHVLEDVAASLRALQKLRSINKKLPLKIMINPFAF